jgi:hypothetical protein
MVRAGLLTPGRRVISPQLPLFFTIEAIAAQCVLTVGKSKKQASCLHSPSFI